MHSQWWQAGAGFTHCSFASILRSLYSFISVIYTVGTFPAKLRLIVDQFLFARLPFTGIVPSFACMACRSLCGSSMVIYDPNVLQGADNSALHLWSWDFIVSTSVHQNDMILISLRSFDFEIFIRFRLRPSKNRIFNYSGVSPNKNKIKKIVP